jgi:hypothetical protein
VSSGRGRCRPRSRPPEFSDHLGFDAHYTVPDHAECPGGTEGEVERATAHEWAAIIDGDHHAAARLRIGDAQLRPERQGRVRAGVAGRIEPPAGRNMMALGVVGSETTEAVSAFMNNLMVLYAICAGDSMRVASHDSSTRLMRKVVRSVVLGGTYCGYIVRVMADCHRRASTAALARRCWAHTRRDDDTGEDGDHGNDSMGMQGRHIGILGSSPAASKERKCCGLVPQNEKRDMARS